MKLVFFFALGFFILVFPSALENSLDWDIDAVFDGQFSDDETTEDYADASPVLEQVMRRGMIFDASFEFLAGIAPGFRDAPWFSEKDFTWAPGARMNADFSLDAQISASFRVKSVLHFKIPGLGFSLGSFFFDYKLYDAVFFRGGKYDVSWGISPNYGFTNLPARVPNEDCQGDSYIIKADVPLGVGGFQVLALTRANLAGGAGIVREDFGYGGKYNLALAWADFNAGAYYKDGMPLRSFLSIKTSLWNVEFYSEGLFAIDVEQPDDCSGAANFGFARNLFNGKLTVNGELFFNAEENTLWYRPETGVLDADTPRFAESFNIAFNMIFRFGGKGNPCFFFQTRYAPTMNSARLVPGFTLSPWPYIDVYLAVPMALGGKDGFYYKNTEDPDNRPFSVTLLVTLKGGVKAEY